MRVSYVNAFSDNYIWLLHHNNKVVAVDPGDAKPVIKALRDLSIDLVAILITHHHFDHTGGVNELTNKYPSIDVYGPANSPAAALITHPVVDNDTITIDKISTTFKVIAIPGHTLDHICYHDGHNLFCGDTLFTGGCGRVFEGTMVQMLDSLQRISVLSSSTNIYCGHEYTNKNLEFALKIEPNNSSIQQRLAACKSLRSQDKSTVPATLALERDTNPFLRTAAPSVISAAESHVQRKLATEVDVFTAIREWKDKF